MALRPTGHHEIVAYLEGFDRDSLNAPAIIKAIKDTAILQEQFANTDVKPAVLNRVWYRRILSSNTLRNQTPLAAQLNSDLVHWDEASHYVASQVALEADLTLKQIQIINALVQSGANPPVSDFRTDPIFTCDEEYLAPQYLPDMLQRLPPRLQEFHDQPLAQAFMAYLWIVTLHPFRGGNGRTARLCGDWLLLSNGYLPIVFPTPVSTHVAVTIGGQYRNVISSCIKYLEGVQNSYQIALGEVSLETPVQ